MPTEKQRLTFISYSRADKEFALGLARELRSSGFRIWLDQLDIPTGSRWDDEVEKALLQCEIFMVILTPNSIASNNVKDEIGYAIDSNKRIMPVLLENAILPFRLRRFQYVDFTSKSCEEGIDSAKQLLRNLLNEPTLPNVPASPDTRSEGTSALIERISAQNPQRNRDVSRSPNSQLVGGQVQFTPNTPSIPVKPQSQIQPQKPPQQTSTKPLLILTSVAVTSVICLLAGWIAWRALPSVSGVPTDTRGAFPTQARLATSTDVFVPSITFTSSPVPTPTDTPTHVPTFTPSLEPTLIPIDPGEFLVDYFNVVILNKDFTKGWSLLTPEYQVQKSGGWDKYIEFWGTVRNWDYSNIEVEYNNPPRARVLITYTLYYKEGPTKSSLLDGVRYCLFWKESIRNWQIDLRENCP